MKKGQEHTSRQILTTVLPGASPGTSRQLDFIHYGEQGNGPKAYIQAALHAGETPGLLVIHKLIALLDDADRAGKINGHIVLAPIANPIGLGQHLFGELAGRYDQATGINFNRNYPDLSDEIINSFSDQLGDDAITNTRIIRKAAIQIISELDSSDETAALKHALMINAIDADIVLDLHCDWQAVMHLYASTPLWSRVKTLAAYIGAEAALLYTVSGGEPFDEAMGGLWLALAEKLPDKNIDFACMAATIELRGQADVEENIARKDALALFHYLQSQGLFTGKAPTPPSLKTEATPLDGVEKIVAPFAGVVSYRCRPGDHVKPGDIICTLFDVTEYDAKKSSTELIATIEGVLFACRQDRMARPGQTLARIAGKARLKHQDGKLLDD